MAKEKPEETRTSIDNINDTLTSVEQKVQKNQKLIMWLSLGAAAIVALIFIYIYGVRRPAINAGDDAIGQADAQLMQGNDSIALAQYMQVADEHGYDAGNRARLNAAILLYKDKKYKEALDYLADYDVKDEVIGAAAQSLEGDCNVNLKNYDAALSCFDAAIKTSNDNPAYTSYFMMKKATVLEALKKYSEAAAVYGDIMAKYPLYGDQNRLDIEKYKLRAEQLAK